MRFIYFILFTLCIFYNAQAQEAAVKPCVSFCTQVPFNKYKEGMRFYVPPNPSLAATNPTMIGYTQIRKCNPDSVIKYSIHYSDIAQKHFELINVRSILAKDNPDGFHRRLFFCLKDLTTNDTIMYSRLVDVRAISQTGGSEYIIEGAISEEAFAQAQQELTNQEFFALFPIGEQRFLPTRITKVEFGTVETPVRIHYQTTDGKHSGIKDVVLCGTNVLSSFYSAFHFNVFFACSNPLKDFANSDHLEAIRRGEGALGMNKNELRQALGKPKKISEVITASGSEVEYTYADKAVVMVNGFVTKITRSVRPK